MICKDIHKKNLNEIHYFISFRNDIEDIIYYFRQSPPYDDPQEKFLSVLAKKLKTDFSISILYCAIGRLSFLSLATKKIVSKILT